MNKDLKELLVEYALSKYITDEELQNIDHFLGLMNVKQSYFNREPGGHITASAWIINPENSSALLTHHKKLNRWLQLGGHCDGNPDVKATALREAQEESGMVDFEFIIPGIFDLDIHALPNSCVYHYDVRFLLRAHDIRFIVSDESHDLAWVPYTHMHTYASETSVLRMNSKFLTYYHDAIIV